LFHVYSDIFKEFLKDKNSEHTLVTIDTPKTNGQVERFNRIVTSMLAK